MTFIRRYSFGAVSLNMLAAAVMFVEALLCIGATQQVMCAQGAQVPNGLSESSEGAPSLCCKIL